MRAASLLVLAPLIAACADDPPDCAPTAGGPYALVEGERLAVTLGCAGDPAGRAPALFTVAPLPAGAVLDPATATLTWTPALDQAAVYDLALGVTGEATTGALRIAVADAFDTAGNVPPLDPTRYGEELGLPVMFVSPAPTSEDYAPVTVVYRGQTLAAEAKLRGASSLAYPKQSYTIKFAPGAHLVDPDRGFPDAKRVVLVSTFDDNSYLRQRLAYDTWDRLDPHHVQVAATSAVVYLDGAFHGLYTMADHVDDRLFEAAGLPAGGNVYKAINHDANFTLRTYEDDPKTTLHDGYVKKDGLPPEGTAGAFDDLDALVDFVARSSDAQFAAELPARIDVGDFRDWYVFVTYLLGSDSGGKNCYLFHDPVGGGPWRYAPWDWNHSFGQAWETSRTGADDWDDFADKNRIFVRMLADPGLGPTVTARYRELLAGPLAEAAVLARFDAMVAETAPVARRDWRAWGAAYRSYDRWRGRDDLTDYDGEVAYVRAWIAARTAFLRARLGS